MPILRNNISFNASNKLPVDVSIGDSVNLDAFSRLRVSNPKTLLDLKQSVDGLPLFYDDAEVSGAGTSSTYLTNKASTQLGVSATTAGVRVKQSKLWGNYQPGKSQLVFITFANIKSVSGIIKMAGYYWSRWGIYTKHKNGTAYVGIRTYNTGSAVDVDIAQSNWNIDKMNGTGNSKITLDFTKTQIFVIDFEWLGVGRVRAGWVIDGIIYYCHEFLHTNNTTEVYMTNPNAPIRYEIQNDGTGQADTFDTICASIISEGGQEQTATSTYQSRNGSSITLANQDLYTPIISFKLKSDRPCTRVLPIFIELLCTTANTNFEWRLYLNPTIAGSDAVSWVNIDNSALQYDVSRTNENTLTGGHLLAGGYGSSTSTNKIPISAQTSPFLTIGSKIDGTTDQLVLGVANIDGNGGVVYGGILFSEYC